LNNFTPRRGRFPKPQDVIASLVVTFIIDIAPIARPIP